MNSDLYAYEKSKMGNVNLVNPVDKKNVVEINDSNTGNYNSNILRYDLSSLYNQALFVDWDAPNSYLAIPIVTHLRLTSGTQTNSHKFVAGANNYALGYKNGNQLVDNCSLKCGNNQLSSGNNNTNILTTFKNLTTYSRDNLENADIWGFCPDGHESWSYETIAGASGTPSNSMLKNNKIKQELFGNNISGDAVVANQGKINDFNSGFYQRIKRLNGNFVGGSTKNNIGAENLLSSSNDNTVDTVTLDGDYNLVYRNMFFIKMKDISDFFSKVGYSRFYCTLEIQLNIGSSTINLGVGTANTPLTDSDILNISSSFQKSTCPFMISKLGEGLNIVAATSPAASTLTIANGIGKSPLDGTYTTNVSNTTLYCQTVQLKSEMESSLLSNKMKQIIYEDFYQADITVDPQASINYIATNGIANLKAILVVPFLAAANNFAGNVTLGANTVATYLSPLLSPLTSEPGCTSPLINISNLQLMLAGERILPSEIKYNFKNYLDNVYGCRSINGGRSEELNSGLINYHMFMNNYRYMYFDVSHIDNTTPKAITLLGKNDNLVKVQLMVFAIYDKKCNLDIASGALNLE